MALVNQDLVLDVVPGPIPQILHLTEYDENMEVVVTLQRRGQPFQIPTGTTVKIEGTLKGHPFSEDGTPSGNTVTFMVSKNMTAYSGRAWTKIKLTKDSKPVSTCGFWLDCDRAGVEAGDVIGAPGFEEQIQTAVDAWIEDNPPDYGIDATLSVSGEAADAKAVGDAISDLDDRVSDLETAQIETDATLTIEGAAADAKAVGDAINDISDGIFEEIEIHPYDTTDGRDLMANGSTIAGTNNIWYYRNLPNRVHIVGSSALGSNKAVVWIVNGSTMLSAPIKGTNESIDQWIDLPDNATGIWVSNPATPTVSVKVNTTKDIYARSYADITEQTTEETALSYYAVDSGHHMTVNGTLSSYSSANIWKFKDLPDRVHVTGSSTGFSGSIAVMWWVAEGAMVSAPIYGSHSVIDKWFDVPEGVEELWLNDGGGNNRLTTLTGIDLVARNKATELEEAVSGAVSIGSQWAGKNWFAYGTSITGGSKMKYPPYLAQMSGLLLNNKGIGGEGIGDLGAGSTGKVYDAICNITDGKLAADLITLETGANDIGDDVPLGTIYDTGRTTLSGCLNDCIRYLQSNTDAQIVITVSPATKTMPSASWKYYEWAEMVEKICKINRVHFINGDNGMGYAKLSTQGKGSIYVIDPIHQTDLGGYIMAQNIWYQLRNIPLFYTQMPG